MKSGQFELFFVFNSEMISLTDKAILDAVFVQMESLEGISPIKICSNNMQTVINNNICGVVMLQLPKIPPRFV